MNTSNLASKISVEAFAHMNNVVSKYNITSHVRLAHFMAQIAHESGNFKAVVENLNYSVDALLSVFPKYFKDKNGVLDKALALKYARNPEMIGSRVYASRMGNGDEASKEGYKFRGRGYLQVTGKDNYKAFSTFIGEDCVANPDLIATKYPMDSAMWFFDKNKLWDICDKGATNEVVTLVTKRVNGGTHGLDDRLSKFNTFVGLLKA
jgi:putative chitinase